MKKNNRKGFTIVELVIVIAVIAILATVLVPTFGNVIADAKNTALIQEIKNEHTNYTMKYATEDTYSENVFIAITKNSTTNYYKFANGSIEMDGDAPKVYTAAPTCLPIYNAATDAVTAAAHTGDGTTCSACGATK